MDERRRREGQDGELEEWGGGGGLDDKGKILNGQSFLLPPSVIKEVLIGGSLPALPTPPTHLTPV